MMGGVAARAREALRLRLTDLLGSSQFDSARPHYVRSWEKNLIEGVDCQAIEKDFGGGAGGELRERLGARRPAKFRACYSSACLAANVFGPWRPDATDLHIPGLESPTKIRFEAARPIFLSDPGARAAQLDLEIFCTDIEVGVESKCTEFLSRKRAEFRPPYFEIADDRTNTRWFAHARYLRENPHEYRHVDAAQLIKHALGLMLKPTRPNVKLLYVYWEPSNRDRFPQFERHREEIDRFRRAIDDPACRFDAISYVEIWTAWEKLAKPEWLRLHLAKLKERYAIEII